MVIVCKHQLIKANSKPVYHFFLFYVNLRRTVAIENLSHLRFTFYAVYRRQFKPESAPLPHWLHYTVLCAYPGSPLRLY